MPALALLLAAADPLLALADAAGARRRAHVAAATAALAARRDGPAPPLSTRPDGPVYRLPVGGQRIRERAEPGGGLAGTGLLFASTPGEAALAPAAGRVAYAGRFRRYGQVVILDHGHGWTTVLTGLSAVGVNQGAALAGGQAIGRAGSRLRILLLHHGRLADLPAILTRLE